MDITIDYRDFNAIALNGSKWLVDIHQYYLSYYAGGDGWFYATMVYDKNGNKLYSTKHPLQHKKMVRVSWFREIYDVNCQEILLVKPY